MSIDFSFGGVDDLTKVPEAYRTLYAKMEDGSYGVQEGMQGVASSIVGLAKSLKAARADAKALKVDLSPLAEYGGTPEEIRDKISVLLKESQEKVDAGAKVNMEKIRQELAEAHAKETKELRSRAESYQARLHDAIVQHQFIASAQEARCIAPELLLPFVREKVSVEEKKGGAMEIAILDDAGERRYSGITGQPMTISDYVQELRGNEKYARLFESESPKGGGGGMYPGSGAKGRERPVLSPAEKIAAGLKRKFG